jgi:hypothetical protein
MATNVITSQERTENWKIVLSIRNRKGENRSERGRRDKITRRVRQFGQIARLAIHVAMNVRPGNMQFVIFWSMPSREDK